MPIIYLQHPVHGFKIATMEMEAESDEQNGWQRYDPDTPSVPEIEAPEVAAPEVAAPEVAAPTNELEVKRRRGRPPVGAAS
jgi:hypothetical protein